jgi:hypothetical protein
LTVLLTVFKNTCFKIETLLNKSVFKTVNKTVGEIGNEKDANWDRNCQGSKPFLLKVRRRFLIEALNKRAPVTKTWSLERWQARRDVLVVPVQGFPVQSRVPGRN